MQAQTRLIRLKVAADIVIIFGLLTALAAPDVVSHGYDLLAGRWRPGDRH